MKKIRIIYLLLFLQLLASQAFASAFVVKRIEFEGLKRIPAATAKSYLPIKRGDILHEGKTGAILKSLYKTGFFEDISLGEKANNTLVIRVVERPTIGNLKFNGNSVIPTDKLKEVMKSLDITEGRVYNAVLLGKVKQGLLNQYYMLGRYNARVEIRARPMSRNRVAVDINISEGAVARIKRISIIGNKVFDESTLTKQMELKESGLFSWVMHSDRYSEYALQKSLDELRSYYLDRGYLRFEIKSHQAQITPDRKKVYLTIVVNEGVPYTVDKYKVKGKTIVSRADIIKQIQVNPGDTFSRKAIMDTQKAITRLLGEKGYLFSKVVVLPELHDKNHKVTLVFTIKPGKRVYVRKVSFSDNVRTNDTVLRREVEQMEAAPASTTRMEESKHRLNLLPFIKDARMSVNRVPGTQDLIDLNYSVKEDKAAQATFKVGYSQVYGTILGAGLNQKNFLGTGDTFGLNLQHSNYEQTYAIDFTDPYYTLDGISRSLNFSYFRVDPGAASQVNSGYTSNQLNAGIQFGIPLGQEQGVYNRFIAGLSYQNTLIHIDRSKVSNQINTFTNRHGRQFHELDLKLGYSRNSFDRAIFPTSGVFQSLFVDFFAPLSSRSLAFYMLNYSGKYYQPLTEKFIFLTKAGLGYGNGLHGINDFPYFRNFYAGGINSVRGYLGQTLGPQDSQGRAFGGNMLVDASMAVIFPNGVSDNLRTSVFVDAGNVYSNLDNRNFGGKSTSSGPIRFSYGLEADFMTPFGPLELSLAKPINKQKQDKEEVFQFALGANF